MSETDEKMIVANNPAYVCQYAAETIDAGRQWLTKRHSEAVAEGCVWFRCHWDSMGNMLIEGWRERPADEGYPRWSLVGG